MNYEEAKATYGAPLGRYLIQERQAGRGHFLFADFITAIDHCAASNYVRAIPLLERVQRNLRHSVQKKNLNSIITAIEREVA